MRTIPFHQISVPGSTTVGDALGWDDILGHRLRDLGAPPIITSNMAANEIIAKSNANVLITPFIGTNNVIGRRSADIIRINLGDNTVLARQGSADIAALTIPAQGVLIRQGSSLAAIAFSENQVFLRGGTTLGQHTMLNNTVLLRAGSNIDDFSMATNTVLLRQGADIVSMTMGDNTVLLKTAGGNIEALTMATNTVLVRSGGDIVALSMPAVADTSGSILVRQGTIAGPGDIIALTIAKNSVLTMDNVGNFRAQQFIQNQVVTGDALGGLQSAVLNANRWLISDGSGILADLIAPTDWMLVGVANAPFFLMAGDNALVGKFGSGATAFNAVATNAIVGSLDASGLNDYVIGTNEVVMRAGGSLTGFAMAADTALIRSGSDIVAQAFVTGDILLHNGTNLTNFNLGTERMLGRQGAGIVGVAWAASSLMVRDSSGSWGNQVFVANSMLTADANADYADIVVGTNEMVMRGTGDLLSRPIADSQFVGRPISGQLGPMSAAQARAILNITPSANPNYLFPVGIGHPASSASTAMVVDSVYFIYVGKVSSAISTCTIQFNVRVRQESGGVDSPEAEVGVFTGDFVANGAATLTRRGDTDVLSLVDEASGSVGVKSVTVALTGVAINADVWVAYGAKPAGADAIVQYDALIADRVQSGVFQSIAGTALSDINGATAMTLESTTLVPAWMGIGL